jgi:uncharacterized membrane protein (UPF0127 family)
MSAPCPHAAAMRLLWLLAWGMAGLLAGCGDAPKAGGTTNAVVAVATSSSAAKTNATEPHFHLDHAQPKGPTAKLWIGATEVQAEVCATLQQVATGLMYREGIGPNEAMLFVFGGTDRRSFYMKNVPFDIAAAYIDAEGVVQEIVQLKKQEETPVPSQSDAIQFVLETAPDWFTRNGVGPGTLIRAERGSLREVFARQAVLR